MKQFLSSMMGAPIVSSSDKYTFVRTSVPLSCISFLNVCCYATGGGIALYDAGAASVLQFAATAESTRSWLLIILTD